MLEEFKRLQAENATLKAHNRQLVGALEHIVKTLNNDIQLIYGKGQKVGSSVWLHNPSNMRRDAEFYEKALQTPPAKLALAEAEVLRAAEVFYKDSLLKHLHEAEASLSYSYFQRMVRAMQEARNGNNT